MPGRTLEQCALELVDEWRRWKNGEAGRFNRIQSLVNRMTVLASQKPSNSQEKKNVVSRTGRRRHRGVVGDLP